MNKKIRSVRALKHIIDDDYSKWAGGVVTSINSSSPQGDQFLDSHGTDTMLILNEEAKRMGEMNHPMRRTLGLHMS
jgi:hypothetical protein